MADLEIVVLKYDADYTKRSKDIKKNTWFSFPNDLLMHPDFDDITGEELKWFCWVVSVCSKVNKSRIRLNVGHAVRKLNLDEKDLHSMIKKLEGDQIHVVSDQAATTPQPDGDHATASTLQTDIQTNIPHSDESGTPFVDSTPGTQNNIASRWGADWVLENIAKIYQEHYPLKKGKSAGIKKLATEIKSADDLNVLTKAINNYKKSITDPKFIKHFDRFAEEWRDWLDPQAGKLQLVKTQSDPGVARAQEAIREVEMLRQQSTNPEIAKQLLAGAKFLKSGGKS